MKPWRLSSISSMSLSAMLQAVSPNDRMAVKDEVIVDLVDRCRSNQKKLMQMLTTIGTTLLGHGSTSAHGFHGTTSKFGFGLFILVQVVLLLDFVHGWNDKWVGYDEQFWYAALLVVSLVCYVATISFASILFHWFAVKMIGYCNSKELQAVVCNLLKESLKQKLNQLGWIERMMIAIRVAKALDYLHSCSPPIIHRDVKSSNILLSDNCQPQLSDFGAAMVHQQTQQVSAHKKPINVVGTFGYMAPEYMMYGKVDEKIDVYSFGVVLLELITGKEAIQTNHAI